MTSGHRTLIRAASRAGSEAAGPVRQPNRAVLGAIVALLALAGAACSGDGADDEDSSPPTGGATSTSATSVTSGAAAERPDPELFEVGDSGFYEVPDPIPAGRPGDLVRLQPVAGAPQGTSWQRIMYLSETLAGEPTVVTGVLTMPDSEPPASGWPLFAHAHGSTGIADDCAPSVSLDGDGRHAIEIALLSSWVSERRIAVVSTDYEGLGGPGPHPMLVGESEGRSVLDSIPAARQVPGASFGQRVGLIGYSQGGHAAVWANEIASEWAPDLDIVGVLAGAPATELVDMVEAQGDGAAVILVTALAAAHPDLDPQTVLTGAGLEAREQLERSCRPQTAPDPPYTSVDVTSSEPWAGLIRANEPGSAAGAAPVLIVHSEQDLQVPAVGSAAFQERFCAAGGMVERRVLGQGDHVSAAVAAYEQGIDWIVELTEGAAARSTCP